MSAPSFDNVPVLSVVKCYLCGRDQNQNRIFLQLYQWLNSNDKIIRILLSSGHLYICVIKNIKNVIFQNFYQSGQKQVQLLKMFLPLLADFPNLAIHANVQIWIFVQLPKCWKIIFSYWRCFGPNFIKFGFCTFAANASSDYSRQARTAVYALENYCHKKALSS